ncbi:MAG: hypothetical protein U0736_07820 [Gemmataceae bacterium]
MQDLAVTAAGPGRQGGCTAADRRAQGRHRRRLASPPRSPPCCPHRTLAAPAVPPLVEIVKNPRVRGQDGRRHAWKPFRRLGQLGKKSDTAVVGALEAIAQDEKLMDNQLKNFCKQALKKLQAN